jgi:hypothetical protein
MLMGINFSPSAILQFFYRFMGLKNHANIRKMAGFRRNMKSFIKEFINRNHPLQR